MKIYSRKKLIRGLVFLIIAILAITSQFMEGFDLKLSILSPLLLIFAYRDMRKSFSKEAVMKGIIEEKDERNQLITNRTNAIAFKIVLIFAMSLELVLIILYGIYKEDMFIPAILTLGTIVTVSFLSSIFSGMYFEKRL